MQTSRAFVHHVYWWRSVSFLDMVHSRRILCERTVCTASASTSNLPKHPMNTIEKIVHRHLLEPEHVRSGAYVGIKPSYVMTHDNTAAVMPKFLNLVGNRTGARNPVKNPRQVVFTLDHNVQDTSSGNLQKYANIEAFANEHEIDFYPAGRGIGHQVMCEEGYAFPYRLVVASDSHSNMYGGVGCLGTPVVRTDAACIWATGSTWWQVPPVARVELVGDKLPPGVSGKDVIVTLCGLFKSDEVLNHAVEFGGSGVGSLSVDERLTIANMTTEWGALAGVFPVDDVTIQWLRTRHQRLLRRGLAGVPSDGGAFEAGASRVNDRISSDAIDMAEQLSAEMAPDPGCVYSKTITLDLSTVRPHVSGPNDVKTMSSVTDLEARQIKINKAYLVSCVNSREQDIATAAEIVRGKSVAPGVKMYVAAASSEVQDASEASGDWGVLMAAGCIPLPPGCGPCIGLGQGLLEDGEVAISATNRNFKGRMGSRNAEAYLASPAVVAASALAGYIRGPEGMVSPSANVKPGFSLQVPDAQSACGEASTTELVAGFPTQIEGRIIFCPQDNINTDGIYPGKYTYREDVTWEQMGEVVMENYDGDFADMVQPGDILVAGYNFGTGSSREQAATALRAAGVAAVICGSVSETYKRNALNNGLIVLEIPALVESLLSRTATRRRSANKPTILLDNERAEIDMVGSYARLLQVQVSPDSPRTYTSSPIPFTGLGKVCQDLIAAGGIEEWVKKQL
eukprot:m.935758 g.935758  ORF g.935758 m.935758 type:complete len:738 (+) comp23806_c2_seq3:146-2359(+)